MDKNFNSNSPVLSCHLRDEACEKAVIATLFKYDWAYPYEAKRLQLSLFDSFLSQCCMKVIIDNNKAGKDYNLQTVFWEIHEKHDFVKVEQIEGLLPFALQNENLLSAYIDRLVDFRYLRKLYDAATNMMEYCHAPEFGKTLPYIGKLRDSLDAMVATNMNGTDSCLSEEASVLEDFLKNRQEGKIESIGTATGFKELDEGGGFLPGQLIVLAGATSHGKSALALTIARHAIQQNHQVAYYSLEMSNQQLCSRFAAMESGISSSRLLNPTAKLSGEAFGKVIQQSIPLLKKNGVCLRFDDSFTADIERLCSSIRSLHYRHHLKGVFIDYLQIFNSGKRVQQREQFLGEAARLLKNLAVELNIWIVALSQFNRSMEGVAPTLDRIRDSGQIAEAADSVILLYRPEAAGGIAYPAPFDHHMVKGTAMIHLAKNRNGATPKFLVKFDKERTLFQPISDEQFENLKTIKTAPHYNTFQQKLTHAISKNV